LVGGGAEWCLVHDKLFNEFEQLFKFM